MPELPEVETVRRSLEPHLVGRTIVRAVLHRRDVLVVPGDPIGGFGRQRPDSRATRPPKQARRAHLLESARIEALGRHGKELAILASDGRVLLAQLGMTGRFVANRPGRRARIPDHTHATWTTDDGTRIRFVDPRRFGGLWAIHRDELEARWARLGPDALTIDPADLHDRLKRSRRSLKAALLDQRVLAGVGNIYADESCFLAHLDPHRPTNLLRPSETRALAEAVRRVLASSLERGGSTLRDHADAAGVAGSYQADHAVYGRGGQPCLECGSPLDTGRLAQRATVWCRTCQGDAPAGS
ncbi:MAG: DNA-formamidopyrimidine glycosylase family protein [Planctomycetota bacterium]